MLPERVQITGEPRARAERYRRNNLRIAIRQLERAELYLVALYSLDLDEDGLKHDVEDVVGRVRRLRRNLLELKAAAS